MSLNIAIVGLPNVGKSTLFNALVKNAKAEAANYPFCTIDPNIGIVEVPDNRLDKLAEISKSAQKVPAIVQFVDVAGLVAGASKGEGLGNKFLANIRECDAICEVVRVFEDPNIVHVGGKIDPQSDISTIETELAIKDLETVEKRLQTIEKDIRAGNKDAIKTNEVLQNVKKYLDDGKPARVAELDEDDIKTIKELGLLTLKPIIYVANVSEDQISKISSSSEVEKNSSQLAALVRTINRDDFIILSAKIEAELNELSDEDRKEYLDALGVKESGLNLLAQKAYDILGLQTYFTSGEKESRAWTIHKGYTAPKAAGVIHDDFERGFIAADVVKYEDFVENNGWEKCKEKGLIKTHGKDYVMQENDVVVFKFNV
ncbi:MAG: redox-regulated ATPase YchF [Candidatus Berkelbacteria bacterium]|nr:redox-regulated ATPase YchF [Candidatus Berkelbacteria bacterium]